MFQVIFALVAGTAQARHCKIFRTRTFLFHAATAVHKVQCCRDVTGKPLEMKKVTCYLLLFATYLSVIAPASITRAQVLGKSMEQKLQNTPPGLSFRLGEGTAGAEPPHLPTAPTPRRRDPGAAPAHRRREGRQGTDAPGLGDRRY